MSQKWLDEQSSESPSVASHTSLEDVLIVDTVELARAVVKRLMELHCTEQPIYHACDTETTDIDVTSQTPVGHGRVICLSVYCGPHVDFSACQTEAQQGRMVEPRKLTKLWVDTYGGEGEQVLEVFKPYLEAEHIKKVWHNYSFDRAVLWNHGIDARGFGGDTMHMARLWDSNRQAKGGGAGYSLASLSNDRKAMAGAPDDIRRDIAKHAKTSMKKLFGKRNRKKDGTEGKLTVLPEMTELQTGEATRDQWIQYSCRDTESTWFLRESLEQHLRAQHCQPCAVMVGMGFKPPATLWAFYERYYRDFGELLTDMERAGFKVNREHLRNAQTQAEADQKAANLYFRKWASRYCEDAQHMNLSSGAQIRQLLFAGVANSLPGKDGVPTERVFQVLNADGYKEPGKEEKPPKKNRPVRLHGLKVTRKTAWKHGSTPNSHPNPKWVQGRKGEWGRTTSRAGTTMCSAF